jgi:hypothetical protein
MELIEQLNHWCKERKVLPCLGIAQCPSHPFLPSGAITSEPKSAKHIKNNFE